MQHVEIRESYNYIPFYKFKGENSKKKREEKKKEEHCY